MFVKKIGKACKSLTDLQAFFITSEGVIILRIYTIGHSTHSQEEFIEMLESYGIELLVDIRSYPGSRYVPQFNKENMERWIPVAGMEYLHLEELGGRRKNNKEIDEKLIDGWDQLAFRNYAGYSLSEEYEQGIKKLMKLTENHVVCYMCSESVPWRCHRLIVSNTMVSKGFEVIHIMSKTTTIAHELGKFGAKPTLLDNIIIYPK